MTPTIVETEALPIAKIRARVPSSEIGRHMESLTNELLAELKSQGITPAGPLFTHHFRPPDAFFDFEVCLPVAAPVRVAGRVEAGEWPAMRVVRAVHQGPYTGLVAAWGELIAWAAREGVQTTQEAWERYLLGPKTTQDSSLWRTELSRPIAD